MPRVSAEHKLGRREEILDAARACFARSGYQGATLQDIFAAAGLSAGCVYSYFQSKQDLVLAIAEARHAEERDALAVEESDPILALKTIARRFVQGYLAGGAEEKRRISLATWSEAMFNDAVLASVRAGVDGPRKALAALVARAQASGALRKDIDGEALARVMTAMLQGLVLQKLWDAETDARAMTLVCEQLIDALCA